MSLATAAQPAPVAPAGGGESVWQMVIRDMGDPEPLAVLHVADHHLPDGLAGNGRDALLDAYQEALDMAVYLRQAIAERGGPPPRAEPKAEVEGVAREVFSLLAGPTPSRDAVAAGCALAARHAAPLAAGLLHLATGARAALSPGREPAEGLRILRQCCRAAGIPPG